MEGEKDVGRVPALRSLYQKKPTGFSSRYLPEIGTSTRGTFLQVGRRLAYRSFLSERCHKLSAVISRPTSHRTKTPSILLNFSTIVVDRRCDWIAVSDGQNRYQKELFDRRSNYFQSKLNDNSVLFYAPAIRSVKK